MRHALVSVSLSFPPPLSHTRIRTSHKSSLVAGAPFCLVCNSIVPVYIPFPRILSTSGHSSLFMPSRTELLALPNLREPLDPARLAVPGSFGENLTVSGAAFSSATLCIGDVIGVEPAGADSSSTLRLQVASSRRPCSLVVHFFVIVFPNSSVSALSLHLLNARCGQRWRMKDSCCALHPFFA